MITRTHHYIATCCNCKASVVMNTEVRHSIKGNILDCLDSIVPCCPTPSFYFYPYPVYTHTEGEKEPPKEDTPMDKFWMVIKAEGGREAEYTRQRHPRYSNARGEAERLCTVHNAAFVVLEAVEVCKPQAQPVNWEVIQ